MFKILLLSWVLLFSHHDSVALQLFDTPPSFIAIKKNEKGTSLSKSQIDTLCNGEATTLDPYDYKVCEPRHAPLPKDIKKLPNVHSRFKAHLKRAALTSGSEMDTLLHTSKSPINRQSLARIALQKTLKQTLLGEIESGVLDTAALGLTDVTAAEISILAAASPEIAVPVLAMVLGGRFYEQVKTAFKNILKRSPAEELASPPSENFAAYLNEESDLKIDSITSADGTMFTVFKKLVPLHCKFPIVRHKLFLGNYKEADLRLNATMNRLYQYLGEELYSKALKNIQPIIDNEQECNYQLDTDKLPPFQPVTDSELETQTQQKNKLFLVLRTITLTTYSSGVTEFQFLDDVLLSDETRYWDQPLPPNNHLHTKVRNGNARFAYRGPAKVYNGVKVSATISSPWGPLTLTTKTTISFYETPKAQITTENTMQLQNVDVTELLKKGDIFQYSNQTNRKQMILDNHISVHDIIDWSTTRRGEQLEKTVALVNDSFSFLYVAPADVNVAGPWWVRGPTLPRDNQKDDTAQALARIIDFLNINTSGMGVMGQIELMIAAAANSFDFAGYHLIQGKLIRASQTLGHAFGPMNFLRVFNVLKAYQQSLDDNLVNVSIRGEIPGGLTTVNYPNKLRTATIDLNVSSLGFESSVPTDKGPKRLYYSNSIRDITDQWPNPADGNFEDPVWFRNIRMKLVSEVGNVNHQSAPLVFEVGVELEKNGGHKKLFSTAVYCTNRGDCSWRRDGKDALIGWYFNKYTTEIGPKDKVLVAITTIRNTSNRDLEHVYPQIIAGFELNYLHEKKTLLSM